jgi:hypothetical protein
MPNLPIPTDVLPIDDGTDQYEVEEQPDGSAVVNTNADDNQSEPESTGFGDNLAETLDVAFLTSLGIDQADLIDLDKEARKNRDKQQAEGIKKTGLGNESPGGATFDGASKAVHPMLAKGCVDFASRAIKELSPAAGPCKTHIVGESTDIKIDKAERKKSYMNWQMTTQVREQRPEFERLLSQLPLGGSQYKRWWWDAMLERPRTEVVYIDDVFLPFAQSDFYTSPRVTHRQWVSEQEFESRIDSELYLDLGLSSPQSPDQSLSKVATDKVEGNSEPSTAYNEEGQREIYMSYVDLAIDDDPITQGRTAPYILHIENDSQKVLGLYRNWKEDDEDFAKKHWMVEYCFIPWRGAYGVGLFHLIGSLASSATGALRALLDSAHISNFPGGLKLKGGRTSGQTVQINATELAEIDSPAGVDDIRKLVMPFPFNGPSPVLSALLDWLTQQGESVIATASEKIADGGANMPVGTALALIEQGSVNFSAIHARCHNSLKMELEILHRLDEENLTDEEIVEDLGELVVSKSDFQGPMDIIPVSDPNIFSEAQRYAQLQAVMQLADNPKFGPLFKPDKVLQRALRLLQIPSPEEIANLSKDPSRLGALAENYLVCSPEPGPIKVYLEQDDLSHMKTHLTFLTSPMFGSNPLIGPSAFGPMMVHIRDHLMNFYKKHSQAATDAAYMTVQAQGQTVTREEAEVQGAAFADQVAANVLGPLMPVLQKAQQTAMQFAPKPPIDPSITAQIAAQQALQSATIAAQEKIEQAKITAQQTVEHAKLAMDVQDADKERQFKLETQTNALQADQTRWQAEQDQNDRATVMATAIEKQSLDMNAKIEQFQADVKARADDTNNQAVAYRQQMKADTDAQLLVLGEQLKAQAAQLTPPDLVSQLAPILQEMQANTQTMLQQLRDDLNAVKEAYVAPVLSLGGKIKSAIGLKP